MPLRTPAHPILPGGAPVLSEAQILPHSPRARKGRPAVPFRPAFHVLPPPRSSMTKTELHNPVTGPQGAHLHPSIRRHHVLWSLLSGEDQAREVRQKFGSGRHGVSIYRFWLSPKKCVWGSGCPSWTLGPQRTPWPRSLMAGHRPWGAALGSDACHRHVRAARRAPSRRTASRC